MWECRVEVGFLNKEFFKKCFWLRALRENKGSVKEARAVLGSGSANAAQRRLLRRQILLLVDLQKGAVLQLPCQPPPRFARTGALRLQSVCKFTFYLRAPIPTRCCIFLPLADMQPNLQIPLPPEPLLCALGFYPPQTYLKLGDSIKQFQLRRAPTVCSLQIFPFSSS